MEMIALGAACLLVRVGLALYGTGLIRAKNAAGAVLRSLCDLCSALLAFWVAGAAVMFNDRHLIAFGSGANPSNWFFLATVVLIGTAIPGAAMSERSRFWPLGSASVLLSILLIPLGANWSWTGWLARLGFVDVGGGSWLHLSGAMCGLAGTLAIGARTGKYNRDGSSSMIPGHNVPLAGIGVLAILVGWAPYLCGCLLVRDATGVKLAATDALLAAAAAGLAAMLLGRYRYGKPDVILTLMGFLGGLVAISAGAGQVSPRWAVLIGAMAGVLVPLSAIWIDLLWHIDDPAGAIAIHGIGGLWGTLAAGIFMSGSASRRLHQLGIQALGAACLALLALALSAALFAILKLAVRLRASEADEFDGLDLAEHDIGAYPDFQQTMIKSYHLREA